jgi:hypothetical protein
MLRGFFRMVSGLQMVTMRDVCMMPGLFMAPSSVVLGRFFVMAGRTLAMPLKPGSRQGILLQP